MPEIYHMFPSPKKDKKFAVLTPEGRTIHFGAAGYSDYTIHKDSHRWERYKTRHRATEDWTKAGINTAGFWALWILWNLPSLRASIQDTMRRFNIRIILHRQGWKPT